MDSSSERGMSWPGEYADAIGIFGSDARRDEIRVLAEKLFAGRDGGSSG